MGSGRHGHLWMMYFFRWFPGRTAALFVKNHRPDICLPASGMTMERDDGLRLVAVNGINLPARSYRFDDRGARCTSFTVIGMRVHPMKISPPRRKRIGQRAAVCVRRCAAGARLARKCSKWSCGVTMMTIQPVKCCSVSLLRSSGSVD